MNFYKEKKWIELDPSQFQVGALYIVEDKVYKVICCCSSNKGGEIILTVVESLRGNYEYKTIRLSVNEEPDPDLSINRVILEMDRSVNKIFLREEKTDYRALADRLYNQLEGVEEE